MHSLLAHELQEAFLENKISAEEIARHFLKRISHFDPKLQSFLAVYSKEALQQAVKLDEKKRSGASLGKLAGIPIAIKDNIHIDGETTTCASKLLENYKAPFDATVISLLKREDALIVGKTNMDEFAMGGSGIHSAFFPTKNPWDLASIPGGSSSGSAAAVSAGLTPLALGTDTGGSIRQPAAFTGIYGFKPTYGRVSRYGLVAFASSLDQIGPMARSVKDLALTMEVIARGCDKDATSLHLPTPAYSMLLSSSSLHKKKIGVPWSFLEKLEGEAKRNFEETVEQLRSAGCLIVDVDLSILKYSIAVYYILATAEASTNLARFDGIRYGSRSTRAKTLEEIYDYSREDFLGSEVKTRILLGTFLLSNASDTNQYAKAQKVRALIIERLKHAFTLCSCIALPTSPSTAFAFSAESDPLSEYLQDLYTIAANMGGLPAISIPSGFSSEGKPFGLQLLGPQLADEQILSYAYFCEQVLGIDHSLPPLFRGDA